MHRFDLDHIERARPISGERHRQGEMRPHLAEATMLDIVPAFSSQITAAAVSSQTASIPSMSGRRLHWIGRFEWMRRGLGVAVKGTPLN